MMQHAPTMQSPGVFRRKIGDMVVTAILDGVIHADYGVLQGVDTAVLQRDMAEAFRPGPPVLSISCFIVHTADKVVMIDTGCGANEVFDGGRLPQALNAAGVSPDGVDVVLVSHLHPDHGGGLATAEGQPFFPNAELRLHADEAKFWLETENPPADFKSYFDAAKAAVLPYRDRMRTFTTGEVAPGIDAEPLPGHTPGHTGFMLTSGADALMMWTDVVHLPPIQTRYPEVYVTFDADPEQAVAQRRRIFDKVATDRLLVAGPHMDFPTFAHLERRSSGGYAVVPEPWRPTL